MSYPRPYTPRHYLRKLSRQASPHPGINEKLFGRYDELVRLFLGFLLTGVIGAYLSQRYTAEQADMSAASKIFNEHSKLIGDRYFAQVQLTTYLREVQRAQRTPDASELATRVSAYKVAVRDWNSGRGFNREMIRMYFGDRLAGQERDIHYMLRAWGQALEEESRRSGTIDFTCLESKSDEFLEMVHKFRVHMASAMQATQVGSRRDTSVIDQKPRPERLCMIAPQ